MQGTDVRKQSVEPCMLDEGHVILPRHAARPALSPHLHLAAQMKEHISIRLSTGESVTIETPDANDVVAPANPAEYMFSEAGTCLYYPGK